MTTMTIEELQKMLNEEITHALQVESVLTSEMVKKLDELEEIARRLEIQQRHTDGLRMTLRLTIETDCEIVVEGGL